VLDLDPTDCFNVIVSEPIPARRANVLTRPYFDARRSAAVRIQFLETLELSGEVVRAEPAAQDAVKKGSLPPR